MTTQQKTVIVTGASQGIGAAVANLFLDRGYNVVGNSRKISSKNELQRSPPITACLQARRKTSCWARRTFPPRIARKGKKVPAICGIPHCVRA